MEQFLIIKLVVWLGWLSCIALAQLELSGAITGSVSFPDVGITCLGNLAVFITTFLRKPLDLEMGARDILAITGSCKLEPITLQEKEIGLIAGGGKPGYEDAHVVMLANSTHMMYGSLSMRSFMKYIYNAYNVRSILLTCSTSYPPEPCKLAGHICNCIKFQTVKEITVKLARHMPRALTQLPDSLCLLPSLQCRINGCHGCNSDLLSVKDDENQTTLGTDNFNVEFPAAVSDALDFELSKFTQKEPMCICIPVEPASADDWTKILVRLLKSKDQKDQGAVVMALETLQSYLDGRTEDRAEDLKYKTMPLIVIRFVEILINLLLTLCFKVDGFSSSLAARRAVRSYVVDSKGNGLPANAFVTRALVVVKSDAVCQVLKFRGTSLSSTLLLIVGCVNFSCSIIWSVLVGFSGDTAGKWYEVPSMAPSKPRVAVIIAAIGFGICMDCFEFFKFPADLGKKKSWKGAITKNWLVMAVIVLEMVFAVVAGAIGLTNGIGRWVYGALQVLVWVKWGIGSYMLGVYFPEYVPTPAKRDSAEDGRFFLKYSATNWDSKGSMVYASSFFLNAVLAAVRGNWNIWK